MQKAWASGKLPDEKQAALGALGVTSNVPAKGKGKGGGNGSSSGGGSGGGSGSGSSGGSDERGGSSGGGGGGESTPLEERKSHKFEEFAVALEAYKSDTGSVAVKRDYETEDGLKLGLWLASHFVKAKRGLLPEDRHKEMRQLFAKLGFDFDEAMDKMPGGSGGGGSKKGGRGEKGSGGKGGGGGRGKPVAGGDHSATD